MAKSFKPADQVLDTAPDIADATVIARHFARAGYGVAEGGFVDGLPVPSRRMQQNGSLIGGRTVGNREDIARHISPTATVLIVRGADGKAFTVDLQRRVVAPLESKQVVGVGNQFADTPQPIEAVARTEATSIVPFQPCATALAAVLSISAEQQRAEEEMVDIGAKGIRLSRELASETKVAQTLSSRRNQGDIDAAIAGVEYEMPQAEKIKLTAAERKIVALPVAIKVVAEQQANKARDRQAIRSRFSSAVIELTGARREGIRQRLILKIGDLAEDLSALVAVEQLQRDLVGEAFAFSSTASPDLWSGEIVALAFAKAIPNRLWSPQMAADEIRARASALCIQQKEELLL